MLGSPICLDDTDDVDIHVDIHVRAIFCQYLSVMRRVWHKYRDWNFSVIKFAISSQAYFPLSTLRASEMDQGARITRKTVFCYIRTSS